MCIGTPPRHEIPKAMRQQDSKKKKAEKRGRSEDSQGRKAISRMVKGEVLKNKSYPIMQVSFFGKGESMLISPFPLGALLFHLNLGL